MKRTILPLVIPAKAGIQSVFSVFLYQGITKITFSHRLWGFVTRENVYSFKAGSEEGIRIIFKRLSFHDYIISSVI